MQASNALGRNRTNSSGGPGKQPILAQKSSDWSRKGKFIPVVGPSFSQLNGEFVHPLCWFVLATILLVSVVLYAFVTVVPLRSFQEPSQQPPPQTGFPLNPPPKLASL